jgi:hypothetical protein
VSGFSEDGQWWWDGATWIPTAQVVLPQLPMTESEKSGRLQLARADKAKGRGPFWRDFILWGFIGLTPVNRDGFREYRIWTIEQLELATAYLLGPDEPLLVGEVSVYDVWDAWSRDLAVAVTAAHVLVFRIDSAEGQPRWVALAGRATDVKIEARTGLFGRLWPALEVTRPKARWTIQGFHGDKFNPDPVLDAWRQAANRTAKTQ